ncbi:MAG TPA: adenylate/guanylate cyclase domain-containing protein [Acidimicrobiia bacterium]|nr:adenylate/guanylate cyclase domain-containing protein [Acidimicrobiia bacterium]
MAELLMTGREAVSKHLWNDAVTAFSAAEEQTDLTPDDLILLADALWWSGEPDQAITALEKAFAGLEREGKYGEAATVGARLAYIAIRRLNMSMGTGWMARVERLLEGQPDSVGRGWLKILQCAVALMGENDLQKGLGLAEEAIVLGKRFDNPGIHALGLSFKGIAMIHLGDWRQGITFIDEATVVATSEQGDLRAACDVYCNTIAACRNLGDYRRAGEWTEKADSWMQSHAVGGYSGICQVHRAELKRLRGSWSEAEQEARKACIELERFHILDGVGFAHYEIGEVRRRMGDLAGAEKSFLQAYEYGHDAQPGLSLLLFDKGEVEEAAKSIAGAIRRTAAPGETSGSGDLLTRARLLPVQVEIALVQGDTDTARRGVEELHAVATDLEGPSWRATALACQGSLDLAEGRPEEAAAVLERAWRLWQESGLPYESAQTRMLLGSARRALGDERGAALEFRASASAFRQLGASFNVRRLQEIAGADIIALSESKPARVTKAFMFTDIVTSTDLIGLIGDAAWENLLRWHDRTLREGIGSHGGEEVTHTGDGFFVAFDDPRGSIDCAVTIQRTLEQHRRDHGFAPWVRIGLHLAEATEEAANYSGQGVHAAARVGALAGKEEIVVSSDLLEAVGAIPYPVSEGRAVSLKGISKPVDVHLIDWH